MKIIITEIQYKKLLKNNYEVINGSEFKDKYLSTDSGYLEKAYFENEDDSMGSVLGRGTYFSVSNHSSDHYENDDYYSGTDYFELNDKAKIILIPNAQSIGGKKIEMLVKKEKVDGVYDPTEGDDNNPYMGLCMYNKKMFK